ncbi:MAG TPA: NIPSNAP family protein, partial [Candidatus Polarisedimenticolia bacterium]
WGREYVSKIRPLLVAQQNKILSLVTPFKPPADSGNIYELRWYRAYPGKLGEWFGLTRGILPAREKYSRNVAYWQTEVSQLNEGVHLWVYRDLNERAAVRTKAMQDPEWQAFLAKALPLLQQQDAVVLTPTATSPMK